MASTTNPGRDSSYSTQSLGPECESSSIPRLSSADLFSSASFDWSGSFVPDEPPRYHMPRHPMAY